MPNPRPKSVPIVAERFQAVGVRWVRVIDKAEAWIEQEKDKEGQPLRYAPSRYFSEDEWRSLRA